MDLNQLKEAVSTHAAIRGTARLQPIGGQGDKVFPPTHLVEKRDERRPGARYATEKRRIGAAVVEVVLLDSVQSQANRMEEALYGLWKAKKIALPVIEVALGFPELPAVSSLTAPHRIADALLRDSLLDGQLFRHSELGKSFTDASIHNAGPLFRVCPTACLFGIWDSTGPKGGMGFKLSRALTSEIIGVDATLGVKTSSRIDPTNMSKDAGPLYQAKDPNEGYTLDEKKALLDDKKKPVLFKTAGKPSEANHGNQPPQIDALGGGVTFDYAQQTVVLSLGVLRKLSFGSEQDTEAVRVALGALGLVSILSAEHAGYDFRSRCHLVPEPGHGLKLEVVRRDGTTQVIEATLGGALELLDTAVSRLPASLAWPKKGETLATLKPSDKLTKLIEKTRELAAAGAAE